jgi:uncharacterized protein YlbG (UPF0298 family)
MMTTAAAQNMHTHTHVKSQKTESSAHQLGSLHVVRHVQMSTHTQMKRAVFFHIPFERDIN